MVWKTVWHAPLWSGRDERFLPCGQEECRHICTRRTGSFVRLRGSLRCTTRRWWASCDCSKVSASRRPRPGAAAAAACACCGSEREDFPQKERGACPWRTTTAAQIKRRFVEASSKTCGRPRQRPVAAAPCNDSTFSGSVAWQGHVKREACCGGPVHIRGG